MPQTNEIWKRRPETGPTAGDSHPLRHYELPTMSSARLALEIEVGPQLNRAIGFTSLLLGVVSGMILGLWSFGGPFPVPASIGEYGDLSRRFLRLGHIAFFGLGLINLTIAGHCGRLSFSPTSRRHALTLINLGNIGLPPLLLAAAWQPVLFLLMPIPVCCVFVALGLTAAAAWRSHPADIL